MAERDASVRLRRAVQENNLFLVKRLIKRTDMRNPDPNTKRYTSLAWAAIQGCEETFEFLLSQGHDDEELSKDSDNNTILTLLADFKPPVTTPYLSTQNDHYASGAALRMAKLYYDRYPYIKDWANSQGKTALHVASMRGNEEIVRMLCDLDADFDLTDNQGNTPLHYASAWGHIPIVQLLIERGCQYAARNNEGFTASDHAYSISTRDTLQDTARIQFENNKRARRQVFAQAAQKGTERTPDAAISPPRIRQRNGSGSHRLRSGSGASRMTGGTTSESDFDGSSSLLHGRYTSNSPMSSPSTHSTHLPSAGSIPQHYNQMSAGTPSTFSVPSPSLSMNSGTPTTQSTLSPITTRMLERDADAMEKYKRRNRSGSAGTTSTDAPSQTESIGNLNGADREEVVPPMNSLVNGSVRPRRLLRPSASAAQLRSNGSGLGLVSKSSQEMLRSRSGMGPLEIPPSGSNSSPNVTTPTRQKPGISTRTSSGHTAGGMADDREDGDYTGPSELYAQFPPPATTSRLPQTTKVSTSTTKGMDRNGRVPAGITPATTSHRRIPFHLLSKPLPPIDAQFGHRRGTSTT
ncbi:ankyrin [Thelephora ganbajun]|uniref:Ankyrin n=1 Tax=Thelephora ganbajun TaxID=370292 RepID=A0ACB6ZUC3_THEGA|nr:ankyrin [Thelephora ganbajun]